MTTPTIGVGDVGPVARRGSGVRGSEENLLAYDLAVITADVEAVVGAAGGWLCDRVRAGWRVSVLADCTSDWRDTGPLTILGLSITPTESVTAVLHRQRPAALAFDARLVADDDPLRREVLRAVDGARTEVTMWGEASLFTSDRRFTPVNHRLSSAARAFKNRALMACGRSVPDLSVEQFCSATLWYPPDGTDLAPADPPGTTE